MSVNIKQSNGSLKKIAGNTILLDATASEIREGTWTNTEVDTATGDTRIEVNVTFDVPMPDTDYMVVFDKPVTGHGESYNYVNVSTKSTTGFTFYVTYTGNLSHTPLGLQVHWYAVRLVRLDGYTELQNKVSNPDSTPTENSTNLVTSGGVYEAIKNASSVFIGTSAEWESETSKTDYQVAILTDKPNVNAVDSTTGDIEVVANKHLVFKGTLEEWEALTVAEKKAYDEALITNDMDTGEVVDAVTDGDMRAVTSNAVYDALNASITDLTADETAMTYEDYTVETLGAHMYQVGGLCWVHIDIRVTYTGEVALDTDGHKDFWSNKFSIPDFDDVSEWNAVPCFGYVSNSHRRFEITLNNFGVTGGQKAIVFRLRYGEDEPIYTGDVFNLRCVCCFAKA